MPPCDGDPCTTPFNSACCSSFSAGGNLPTAQKTAPSDRLPQMPWSIGQWCGHPCPTPGLPPRPSNPRVAARGRLCASNHSACQRSRSRGVGARYIRRRASASSIRHRSNSAPSHPCPTATPTMICSPTNSTALILTNADVGFTLASV